MDNQIYWKFVLFVLQHYTTKYILLTSTSTYWVFSIVLSFLLLTEKTVNQKTNLHSSTLSILLSCLFVVAFPLALSTINWLSPLLPSSGAPLPYVSHAFVSYSTKSELSTNPKPPPPPPTRRDIHVDICLKESRYHLLV